MHYFYSLVIFTIFSIVNGEEKLNVTVLYESLCPDSVRFIQNELAPNYEYIKDYVNIIFVPFGNSNSSADGSLFECQHGTVECDANRMQSCALSQIESQDSKVKFVICQMIQEFDKSGKDCIKTVDITLEQIDDCIKSDIGKKLQLEAEILTKSYLPKFIPTIIYNSVFNQTLQDRSLLEFLTVVCEQLKSYGLVDNNPKLSKCVESSDA